jgi:hypothetical protein
LTKIKTKTKIKTTARGNIYSRWLLDTIEGMRQTFDIRRRGGTLRSHSGGDVAVDVEVEQYF